jgi:hypothetical protein
MFNRNDDSLCGVEKNDTMVKFRGKFEIHSLNFSISYMKILRNKRPFGQKIFLAFIHNLVVNLGQFK